MVVDADLPHDGSNVFGSAKNKGESTIRADLDARFAQRVRLMHTAERISGANRHGSKSVAEIGINAIFHGWSGLLAATAAAPRRASSSISSFGRAVDKPRGRNTL